MNNGKLSSQLFFVAVLVLATAWSAKAEEAPPAFKAPRTYTSGTIVDYSKSPIENAEKGAGVLVWQRNEEVPAYEVEIFRRDRDYIRSKFISEQSFFHVMVFFDKDYEWRVRYLDKNQKPISPFSSPSQIRIVSKVVKKPVMASAGIVAPSKGQWQAPAGPRPTVLQNDSEVEQVVVDLSDDGVPQLPKVKMAVKEKVKTPSVKVASPVELVGRQPLTPARPAASREVSPPPKVEEKTARKRTPSTESSPEEGLFVEESSSDEADFDY